MSTRIAKNISISLGRTGLSIQSIINEFECDKLKNAEAEGLPEAFHGVLFHLPVVEAIFKSMASQLEKMRGGLAEDKNTLAALAKVHATVHKCEITARKLDNIYKAVVPGNAKTRQHRYRKSLEGDETVEVSMKGMVQSMLEMTGSPLGVISKSEEQRLKTVLEAVSKLPISLEEEEESKNDYYITNSGSGLQPVHAGRGNQAIYGHNLSGVFRGSTNMYSGNPSQGHNPQPDVDSEPSGDST